MIKILFGIVVVLASFSVCAAEIKPIDDNYSNKIADAIFKIEGGYHTKYPYGIKSVRTNNPRKVCLNTIKNNYIRWEKSDQKIDFLNYLANIYCPTNGKSLTLEEKKCNKYWLINIRKILKINNYGTYK